MITRIFAGPIEQTTSEMVEYFKDKKVDIIHISQSECFVDHYLRREPFIHLTIIVQHT
jgi:hypothetical protein